MPIPAHRRTAALAFAGCACAIVASLILPGFSSAADVQVGAPEVAGLVVDAELGEISGLAVSRRHRNVLWAVNDGGNTARLFAMSPGGRKLAAFDVEGVDNVDWEDLASFIHEGRQYLVIADTGDNGGVRATLDLVLVEEPASLRPARISPVARLTFRWPDGPRDCEAVAVDGERGDILLLSKKRVPAQLFRLPLSALFRPVPGHTVVPQEIGQVRALPQPTAKELAVPSRLGRYRAQISGMALRDDGLLAVQTYRDTYLYLRRPGEGWRQTLRRAPQALNITVMPQPEAVAFDSRSGDLYIASERTPSPILRVRRLKVTAGQR